MKAAARARVSKRKGDRRLALADAAWSAGDLPTAFQLYLQAANRGARQAFRIVAQFYDLGQGVKTNRNQAITWYRRAARENTDAAAANNLGCIYRDQGHSGRALWWLRRAVALGGDEAHLNIAKIYRKRGDPAKARRHLELLLQADDVLEGVRDEAARLNRRCSRAREETG